MSQCTPADYSPVIIALGSLVTAIAGAVVSVYAAIRASAAHAAVSDIVASAASSPVVSKPNKS